MEEMEEEDDDVELDECSRGRGKRRMPVSLSPGYPSSLQCFATQSSFSTRT